MLPVGLIIGTIISSPAWQSHRSSCLLWSGYLTPLVLFLPGSLMTMVQRISLPYAQAGAMATVPALAGTAAGIGVFVQNFLGAGLLRCTDFLRMEVRLP